MSNNSPSSLWIGSQLEPIDHGLEKVAPDGLVLGPFALVWPMIPPRGDRHVVVGTRRENRCHQGGVGFELSRFPRRWSL